jgi:hypothetical protein
MQAGGGLFIRSVRDGSCPATPAGTERKSAVFEPMRRAPAAAEAVPSDATDGLAELATARSFASHVE